MTKSAKTIAHGKGRSPGLGDTELVLLASGSQHPERLIEAPDAMKPATRQRAGANLVKRGLAEERPARAGDTVWREGEGERVALRITGAGLAAIGIEESEPVRPGAAGAGERASETAHPREGSKGALLVSMLTRGGGASIDELMAATGWLPHTTRAALSGLRKRGYDIDRSTVEGASRYRIGPLEPEPAPARRGRKRRSTDTRAAA